MEEGKEKKTGTRKITTIRKKETTRIPVPAPKEPEKAKEEKTGAKKPPEPKPEFKKKPAGPTKTVLIADDNTPIRNIIRTYMIAEGYEVIEASDGAKVLEAVEHTKPDLFLLDVMMPKMDGLTVSRKLRTMPEFEKTPIIICTAKGAKEDVVVAIKAGASDYIVKPFTRDILMAKVRKLLEEAAPKQPG